MSRTPWVAFLAAFARPARQPSETKLPRSYSILRGRSGPALDKTSRLRQSRQRSALFRQGATAWHARRSPISAAKVLAGLALNPEKVWRKLGKSSRAKWKWK